MTACTPRRTLENRPSAGFFVFGAGYREGASHPLPLSLLPAVPSPARMSLCLILSAPR